MPIRVRPRASFIGRWCHFYWTSSCHWQEGVDLMQTSYRRAPCQLLHNKRLAVISHVRCKVIYATVLALGCDLCQSTFVTDILYLLVSSFFYLLLLGVALHVVPNQLRMCQAWRITTSPAWLNLTLNMGTQFHIYCNMFVSLNHNLCCTELNSRWNTTFCISE